MRKTVICFALVALLGLGGQAIAEICTVDDVPAATLLLPYFEVDPTSTDGVTTLFEINNASAAAAIAHVVVWSDLSVPALDFNVYLTGYDVVPINMRDVLNGILPNTAPADLDPADTISPQGALSDDDGGFAGCSDQLPPDPLPASFVNHLQSSLTGEASALFGGNCFGRQLGDDLLRGYVTVDVVDSCSLQFPGSPGYFGAGGTGTALNDNILWGNYYYVEPGNAFAQGETLVHVEADALNPETAVPGEYTFYGRYTAPVWSAADNREPLATNFAARYLTDPGSGFDGSDLIVWRDSHVNQGQFNCTATLRDPGPANAQLASWFPLGQEEIVIFDEQEQIEIPDQFPVSPVPPGGPQIAPFPAEAQRVSVGSAELPTPFLNGWMYLNLNHGAPGMAGGPPENPDAAQAWVSTIIRNEGVYSVGYNAIQLDSACNAATLSVAGNLDSRDGDIDVP
jgi:hypothetical protein